MIDLKKPRLIPRDAHYCDGCIWFKNKDGPCRYLPRKACVEAIARFNALRDFCDAIESGELVQAVHSHWNGWTTSAYKGLDEYAEPIWHERKFYRCDNCRKGTAVKTNYCPNCGAKMKSEGDKSNE